MLLLAVVIRSGAAEAANEDAARERLTWPVGRHSVLTLSPDVPVVYPRYIADPRRPQNSVGLMNTPGSDIPEAGDSRVSLNLGGRVPLARIEEVDGAQRWQLYLEGGYFGQFDKTESLDEIGWDGWYAGHLAFDPGSPLRFKIALRHLSAHLGDEIVQRTGRLRADYTRHDFTAAVAWARPRWMVYAEGGTTVVEDFPEQEPGVAQIGAQVSGGTPWWRGAVGWYAAIDAQSFQENDWDPGVAAEVGLNVPIPKSEHVYRIGLQGYRGRAILGEYNRINESYVAFVIGFDL
ncbi:MAG TPA: DUF1207 domain-containing protein [Planctomycetota bacterium]|nr:DUF1207 domain-containing protein [Planctomycetota bacterium]